MNTKYNTKIQSSNRDATAVSSRIFSRVLQATQPHINLFSIDPQQHIAQGIMTTRTGVGYSIILFFNDTKKLLGFVVRFELSEQQARDRLHSLLRSQNSTAGLSRITFDTECQTLQIQSFSVLPNGNTAPVVVNAVLQDLRHVLESEELFGLLN